MTTLNELRSQADEIAAAGHAGWGNTMRDAADEIDRLRTEAVAADIRIGNDALVIAGLTAERDALARCKLADQDAYVAMRDQRDAARADALRYRYLRDDCLRARWQDTAFVNAPSKWLPEHQTTTAEDDAAIDAAIRGMES